MPTSLPEAPAPVLLPSPDASAPPWLAALRAQGAADAQALPLPRLGDEAWRFSDTRSLTLDGFAAAPEPAQADIDALVARSAALVADPAGLAVFIDGHCVLRPSLSPELATKGVVFETLADAVKHRPSLLQGHLLRHPAILGGAKFLALHKAWLGAGTVLHVPKGVKVDRPFVAVHWGLAEGAAVFPHSLVVAEASSEAAVADFFLGAKPETRTLSVSAADIHAGPNASVHRLSVQDWGRETQSFQVDTTTGGRDARITSVNASLGARRARLENVVRIEGEGADVRLYGIGVADGEQEFDQRTLQVHQAGSATSDLLFKNALLGKARTIFSGLIKVAPDAQRTDAYQTNRNLLLSPEAEANSLPGLEIEANDVKCSHGATTGQIDPAELFYLRARGIPLETAQELLAFGFLEEIVAKVADQGLAATLRERLQAKFQR
jgi:Fe-S cluster assembly protein SufD